MSRASLLSSRRAGFEISRRSNAHRMETMTMTATMSCMARTAAQTAPPAGIRRTASMMPPVTMLAVPRVRRTKPQKIPKCISPARTSLNILVWTKAYRTSPAVRAPRFVHGLGPVARAAAKIRR
jgi:hypothetical protein